MLGVEVVTIRKIVITSAVLSMFRVAPGVDIAIAADQKRVDAAGVTRAMYNVGSVQPAGSSETKARTFIQSHRSELGISAKDSAVQLRHYPTTNSPHLRFEQTYNGLPVHRGEVIVSMNSSNEVGMVVNNFKSNITVALPSRIIGEASAIAAVRATLPAGAKLIGQREEALRMIWQDKRGEYHVAYRVRFTTESPSGDWEAFVEARSGTVLHIENRFTNYVQGSGYVYLSDPLSAAHRRYGSPGFADNNDADSDSLTFYRSRVTLDSLTFEDGVYKLKGPFCEVTDIESPADPIFYSSTTPDGFDFTRSRQEFEAVNVYYHVSQSYRYIQSLGFSSASLRTIRLDPHGLQGVDNSHYSPNGNWIAWGEGGVDDAEDVDAILHEYGHAIVFNLCPSWGGGESGALGEGYSDYWATSNSRSIKGWQQSDYEYNWVYNWNAHNMFMLGRCVNDQRTYPMADFTNPSMYHDAGQVWSSALMSIWSDLGKEVTDKLVLKSLQYLGAAATAGDAAQALLQADRDLFGGAHLSRLVYWLGTVKRFIEPTNYVPTITHTPLSNATLQNWPLAVQASVSQNRPVERVWVEYTVQSGESTQTFALTQGINAAYGARFPLPASSLHDGDTITYRIYAQYSGTLQAVAIVGDFKFRISGTTSVAGAEFQPMDFSLKQNYPNPFNPSTTIAFSVPETGEVSLRVYDMLGKEVATLVAGTYTAGTYSAVWNGADNSGKPVASGTYVYALAAKDAATNREQIDHKKLMLVK